MTGSPAPAQGDELADGGEPAGEAVPPLPRRIPGQARRFWPSRDPGAADREPGATGRESEAVEQVADVPKSESDSTTRDPDAVEEEPDAAKSEPDGPRRGPGAMTGIPASLRPGLSAWLASQRTAAGEPTPVGEPAPIGEPPQAGMATSAGKSAPAGKPTPADLGIDLATLEWECSGDGEGRIEVAFPSGPVSSDGATWVRGEWVIMRVTGDLGRRVLVFDRNEWECFLDGVRNGEFDDAV